MFTIFHNLQLLSTVCHVYTNGRLKDWLLFGGQWLRDYILYLLCDYEKSRRLLNSSYFYQCNRVHSQLWKTALSISFMVYWELVCCHTNKIKLHESHDFSVIYLIQVINIFELPSCKWQQEDGENRLGLITNHKLERRDRSVFRL